MKILVNNETKELEITDYKTGCNWEQDLIGNADGFDGYDDEKEMNIMEPETFKWWSEYIKVEQNLQDKIHELRNSLDNEDAEKFEQDIIDSGDNDYEMMQNNLTDAIANWEAK